MTHVFDIQTRNISFLHRAQELKHKGIRNHLFFLALQNQKLIGVDPFSPYLSNDQKEEILTECINNPWYFIRECVRVPSSEGDLIPFQLTKGRLATMFAMLQGYNVINKVVNKQDVHTSMVVHLWAVLFISRARLSVFAPIKDQSHHSLAELRALRNVLPTFIQVRAHDDIDNVNRMWVNSTHGSVNTYSTYRHSELNPANRGHREVSLIRLDESHGIRHILKLIVQSKFKRIERSNMKGFTLTIFEDAMRIVIDEELLRYMGETPVWEDQFYDAHPAVMLHHMKTDWHNQGETVLVDYTRAAEYQEATKLTLPASLIHDTVWEYFDKSNVYRTRAGQWMNRTAHLLQDLAVNHNAHTFSRIHGSMILRTMLSEHLPGEVDTMSATRAEDFHNSLSRYMPEYHERGFQDMDMIDWIQFLSDARAFFEDDAVTFGNYMELIGKKYNLPNDLYRMLKRTAERMGMLEYYPGRKKSDW